MDKAAALAEIASWTVDEQIHFAQAIWETIASGPLGGDLGLSPTQQGELDRRLRDLDGSPNNVTTWGEIKARITGRS